jgi:hypothetical protein
VKVPAALSRPVAGLSAPRVRALALPLRAWVPWAAGAAAALGALVAVAAGRWWLTPAAGVVIGLAVSRHRPASLAALVVGAFAWAAPLAWLSLSAPVWRAAGVLAGILGVAVLGPPLALLVTALLGAILCLAGSWVGAAVRSALTT